MLHGSASTLKSQKDLGLVYIDRAEMRSVTQNWKKKVDLCVQNGCAFNHFIYFLFPSFIMQPDFTLP